MKFDDHARTNAARWFAALRRGPMSVEEQREFDQWRSDPVNQASLNAMHELWGEVAVVGELRADLLPRRRRRLPFAAAAAILALIGGEAAFIATEGLPFSRDRLATTIGEQRTTTLSDGSVITANVATSLSYAMRADERSVDMREGEAAFFVRKDRTRPFLVRAGNYQIRAVGTAFNVRYRSGALDIAVIEGTVAVTALTGPRAGKEIIRLDAGRKIAFDRPEILEATLPHIMPISPQNIVEWRTRTLDYEDVPIARIVEDLNLFFARPIVVTDSALASRRVTLRLQVEDRERALSTLAGLLNLRVLPKSDSDVMVAAPADRDAIVPPEPRPAGTT